MLAFNNGILVRALILCAFIFGSPAMAHHKPGHEKGGGAAKYGDVKGKKKHAATKRKGPPSWAPAHGYRNKHRYRSVDDGKFYEVAPADLVTLPAIGQAQCNRETLGAILGAAVGGAVGSRFGKGDGKVLASVGGAIVGTLVGGSLGRAMDQVDQNCVGQALERAPTGTPVTWHDAGRSADFSVTPTRTFRASDRRHCREYQTQIVIAGRVENAHGTACRRADGHWETVAG